LVRPAPREDYRLLRDSAEVGRFAKFHELRREIAESAVGDSTRLQRLVASAGIVHRVYYVIGAFMARRIEEVGGRAALLETVTLGPRAFFAAYAATRPPREFEFQVPAAR
jgi:hypothetical protein